ncbi:MAG: outer membrane protein assembly factor BamD [Alphaproteobacteria bacterium]|nr:outer membrane protein assembly factor BamD [Alphaproteobacteria bacterium]
MNTQRTITRILTALMVASAIVLSLQACSSKDDKKKANYSEARVGTLYNQAMDLLLAQSYKNAAAKFDDVDRQHPYSQWANRAQLMSAYAKYRDKKYDDSIIGLDRFIQLHPNSRNIAYARYLKGQAYYEQIKDIRRDQSAARQSMKSFEELVRRNPNSRYARDARRKIDLVRDHLAGKEMDVGRFYLKRNRQLAAIGRFRTVVEKYQTTSHVPEALYRLTAAYAALGVTDEARKIAAVLGYNYPASEWYIDSYSVVTGKEIKRGKPLEKPVSFTRKVLRWLF